MDSTPSFKLSLRITHPSINPNEISEALKLEPALTHCVGEARKTPRGHPLKGHYKLSYWLHRLAEGDHLIELVKLANDKLSRQEAFLNCLTETGGEIEYFVGCFVDSNTGGTLDWRLLQTCADLKINLSFDVYGNRNYSTSEAAE